MILNTTGIITVITLFYLQWTAISLILSFFYHRKVAHDMFEFTNKNWRKFFHFLAFVIIGPCYLNPRSYAIMDRIHHAYADTDLDPHRPIRGFGGFFKSLWVQYISYSAIHKGETAIHIFDREIPIEESFKKNVDDWPIFDFICHSWLTRILWIVLYIMIYSIIIGYFGLSSVFYLMIFFHSIIPLLQIGIINYYAHIYGETAFYTNDTSKNMPLLLRISLGLCGELLHNNHHARPKSPDFSLGNPEQRDSCYEWLIKPALRLEIIKLVK